MYYVQTVYRRYQTDGDVYCFIEKEIIMKKFIAFILFILLLSNIAIAEPVYGPPTPTYSNPVCEYIVPDNINEIYEWIKPQISCLDDLKMDEAFYTLVLPYNTDVIWHFSIPFFEMDTIYIVLVNEQFEVTNILRGHPLPDCTVLFDFSSVEGGTYYFFELSDVNI